MARRPTLRTNLRLERLEAREVLTAGGPSATMQEMLEWVNLARVNPGKAADLITNDLGTDNLGVTLQNFHVDLNQAKQDIASKAPAQPLAWSDNLAAAAAWQSNYQAANGVQTHDGGPGHSTPDDRITDPAIGNYTNRASSGENAFAYADDTKNAMEAFLIDWGNEANGKPHLTNLFNPSYHDVGFGITATSNNGLGPLVVTQDFGSKVGQKADLLGVAFNDNNGDGIYQAGEGVGNLSIDLTDSKGNMQTVQTWDAGGYQVALAPGQYTVTARMGNRVFSTQNVTIGTQNIHLDFILTDAWQAPAKPVAATPAPAAMKTQAVAPTPAPVVVAPTPTPVVVAPTPAPVVVTPPPAPAVAPTPAPAVVTPPAPVAPPVVVTPVVAVVAPTPAPEATIAATPAPAVITPPAVPTPAAPAPAVAAIIPTPAQETLPGGAPTEGQDTSTVGSNQEMTASNSPAAAATSSSASNSSDPLNSLMGLEWQTWDDGSSGTANA